MTFSKTLLKSSSYSIEYTMLKQENAMRCNNRDDLLQLDFTLKNLIFSEAYI